jgi:hypothetical protein
MLNFMAIKLTNLGSFLAIATLSIVTSVGTAKAQEQQPEPTRYQPFAEEFNRAFRRGSGDFFRNRQLAEQLGDLFGVPSFPDQAISQDNKNINKLYRELMEAQFNSTPIIRTPDLPSPYDSSIMTAPASGIEWPGFGGN